MMRKILTVFLLLVMATQMTAYAEAVEYGEELQNAPQKTYAQRFSDVPEAYWAFSYIGEMVERGVLNGYPDGTFRPNNMVSRAEFSKIMVNAAGLTAKATDYSSFSDVATTDWYCPFIETAKDYLTGYSTPSGGLIYKPMSSALREDIAVALVKIKGYDTGVADLSVLQAMFKDYDGISESAKRYVAVAVERGLVSGYPDETFRAQAGVTRAEATALLWRAYQYGNDNKVSDINQPGGTVGENAMPVAGETIGQYEQAGAALAVASKPYKVETLVKTDMSYYAGDYSDNIYYVESKRGAIFQFNIASKSEKKILDLSSFTVDTDEMTLSDFYVTDLSYDLYGDRLLIQGGYKTVNSSWPVNNNFLYGYESDRLSLITNEIETGFIVKGTVGSGDFLASYPNDAAYIINSMDFSKNRFYYFGGGNDINAVGDSNGDICFTVRNSAYIYNFSNTENIFNFSKHASAIRNQKVYTVGDLGVSIFNMKGKALTEYTKDSIQVKDSTNLNLDQYSIAPLLIITQNEGIVFYDNRAKAFRVISAN